MEAIDVKYPMRPVTVGSCAGCGGDVLDYEMVYCPGCGEIVHIGCLESCVQCGHRGCRACLDRDAELMEWFCRAECRAGYVESGRADDAAIRRRMMESTRQGAPRVGVECPCGCGRVIEVTAAGGVSCP